MKWIAPLLFFAALAASGQEASIRVFQSPQYEQAYAELTSIGLAICLHIHDLEHMPDSLTLEQLSRMEMFTEKQRRLFLKKDPWGHSYYYKKVGWQFWVATAGSDGVFKGFDQFGRWEDETKGEDIIYSNCMFVYIKLRPPAMKPLDGSFGVLHYYI